MFVLATVLSKKWTSAEVLEPREIWNTDSIAVTPQWITADTLRTYCQARLKTADDVFKVKLLRELQTTESGSREARFGAAVLTSSAYLTDEEVQRLRGELGRLAQLIKRPAHESTIDITESDSPTEAEASHLRQDLVRELRDKHGGKKLKETLEICTDSEHLVRLTGTLLDRPDDPAKEIPAQIRGAPDEVSFSKSWVKLKSEDQDGRPKLYVSDQEIWHQVLEAGRNHDVVTLKIRVVEAANSSKIEVTECQVEQRNADPLTAK